MTLLLDIPITLLGFQRRLGRVDVNFYLNSGVLGQKLTDVEHGEWEIKKVDPQKGFYSFSIFLFRLSATCNDV